MTRASMVTALAMASLASFASHACAPSLGQRDSLVTRERVLAIRGEPAEAAPGDDVTYTALVASPDGTVTASAIAWAACATPKPLGENDVVPPECLGGGDAVRPLGDASASSAIHAALPSDACALYGPDTPSGDYRPRDPDVTGGFYEPVRATLASGSGSAIHLERVACKLANAPADVASDFAKRYVRNANPHLDVSWPSAPVVRGGRVELTASWKADDAETYVVFDPASQSVAVRRESMRVSWFASAGSFDADRTGQGAATVGAGAAPDELATSSTNGWVAPSASGSEPIVVHVWVVVRDSRGGIEFVAKDLAVAPE